MEDPRRAFVVCSARLPAMGLVLLLLVLLWPGSVSAQDSEEAPKPSAFESIESCRQFSEALSAVHQDSALLEGILAEPAADREALLMGIFQGTQLMLSFGEAMFEASDQFEEKCKAALREADQGAEIATIYELALEPTLRSYEFLVRVRNTAANLKDEQTAKEIGEALDEYKNSALRLIDFCESSVPKEAVEARCGEIRKRMDERLQ